VAGGRTINHDEVGGMGPIQLQDLAQDKDVANAWNPCGGDVKQPRPRQAPRGSTKPVVAQIFNENIFCSDRKSANRR
jgi:hypothetical protein